MEEKIFFDQPEVLQEYVILKFPPIKFQLDKIPSIKVTSSRVVMGNKNFTLRNISAVQTQFLPLKIWVASILSLINLIYLINLAMHEQSLIPGIITTVCSIGIIVATSNVYFILLEASGTKSRMFWTPNADLINSAVDAINNALLELDRTKSVENKEQSTEDVSVSLSQNQMTDIAIDLKRLKDMVRDGLITEDDYEKKKNQLLGL